MTCSITLDDMLYTPDALYPLGVGTYFLYLYLYLSVYSANSRYGYHAECDVIYSWASAVRCSDREAAGAATASAGRAFHWGIVRG